jgi:hypothetical protein
MTVIQRAKRDVNAISVLCDGGEVPIAFHAVITCPFYTTATISLSVSERGLIRNQQVTGSSPVNGSTRFLS